MIDIVEDDRLAKLIGIEGIELSADRASGHLPVTDRIRQPFGIVHGGALAVFAETICSAATYTAVSPEGMIALGQINSASFIRPVREGTVHANATVRHRGRTTWIWDCDLTDDAGRLCAIVRMTVAVRPAPAADGGG